MIEDYHQGVVLSHDMHRKWSFHQEILHRFGLLVAAIVESGNNKLSKIFTTNRGIKFTNIMKHYEWDDVEKIKMRQRWIELQSLGQGCSNKICGVALHWTRGGGKKIHMKWYMRILKNNTDHTFACSNSSRSKTPAPSPMTNPSRFCIKQTC